MSIGSTLREARERKGLTIDDVAERTRIRDEEFPKSLQEAYELGLADKLAAPEELMDKAMELMGSFTKNAPLAVGYAKRAIDEGYQLDIDGGVRVENKWFGKCFSTEDQKEGMAAFLEKRPAEFKNK